MRELFGAAVIFTVIGWVFLGVTPRIDNTPLNNWALECTEESIAIRSTPHLLALRDVAERFHPKVSLHYGDVNNGLRFSDGTSPVNVTCPATHNLYFRIWKEQPFNRR